MMSRAPLGSWVCALCILFVVNSAGANSDSGSCTAGSAVDGETGCASGSDAFTDAMVDESVASDVEVSLSLLQVQAVLKENQISKVGQPTGDASLLQEAAAVGTQVVRNQTVIRDNDDDKKMEKRENGDNDHEDLLRTAPSLVVDRTPWFTVVNDLSLWYPMHNRWYCAMGKDAKQMYQTREGGDLWGRMSIGQCANTCENATDKPSVMQQYNDGLSGIVHTVNAHWKCYCVGDKTWSPSDPDEPHEEQLDYKLDYGCSKWQNNWEANIQTYFKLEPWAKITNIRCREGRWERPDPAKPLTYEMALSKCIVDMECVGVHVLYPDFEDPKGEVDFALCKEAEAWTCPKQNCPRQEPLIVPAGPAGNKPLGQPTSTRMCPNGQLCPKACWRIKYGRPWFYPKHQSKHQGSCNLNWQVLSETPELL